MCGNEGKRAGPGSKSGKCFLTHLETVERAVVLDNKVLELVHGEVVPELTEEVGKMDGLDCVGGDTEREQS